MRHGFTHSACVAICVFGLTHSYASYAARSSDDADDWGHCQNTNCGALYANVVNMAIDLAPQDANGIIAVGQFSVNSAAKCVSTERLHRAHGLSWSCSAAF
jgi:hypothetical protein